MQIFPVIGRRGRRHKPKKQLFLLKFAVNSISNHCAGCRNDDFFTLSCRFYFTLRTKVSRIRRTIFPFIFAARVVALNLSSVCECVAGRERGRQHDKRAGMADRLFPILTFDSWNLLRELISWFSSSLSSSLPLLKTNTPVLILRGI